MNEKDIEKTAWPFNIFLWGMFMSLKVYHLFEPSRTMASMTSNAIALIPTIAKPDNQDDNANASFEHTVQTINSRLPLSGKPSKP